MNLKGVMGGVLSDKEIAVLPNSFDVVGDILIFADFPKELEKKERKIAYRLIESFPNIAVVCRKTRKYGGKYRLPRLKIMGGKRRKETTYRENGISVMLHVEKVYFSPRLSNERKRINRLILDGEDVLVMFSGSGVYPINISKNTRANRIVGVEINPVAHEYAFKNASLNKADNVDLILGDVNIEVPKLSGRFDRIIMPLPKGAESFLSLATKKIKKKGIIHLYQFLEEESINKRFITERISGITKRKFRIISIVKCGQYGPGRFRVCVDIKMQ